MTETNTTLEKAKQLHLLALAHLLEEEKSGNHTPRHLHSLIGLLDEGATVPFIARYRKEMTGAMDEVVVLRLKDRFEELCELEDRKQTILDTIQGQNKLTLELEKQISACRERNLLEDLYLPFKPKRRTKASMAREKGLEPLAAEIFAARGRHLDLESLASPYIDVEKGVSTTKEALEGATHIIAEWLSETAEVRAMLRQHLAQAGEIVVSRVKEKTQEPTKYEMYYDFREGVSTIPSHRYLAIRRGEEEGYLKFTIEGDRIQLVSMLDSHFLVMRSGESAEFLRAAILDALDRLMLPSLITEVRLEIRRRAEAEAISVFAQNIRPVLLSPPAGERRVIGIDPGYRTGCKLAVIDETGKLLDHKAIYPHEPHKQYAEAKQFLLDWINKYQVSALAVGNGTASRETMQLAQELAQETGISAVLVNESGASIYSASELARTEFPDIDLTVRSAVSIARRLQDPLAEMIKIDAKSIGVGQYQHDVDQATLKKSLDNVVESCVNYVGVDLNTASEPLLRHVSGIGPVVAKEIVRYRDANGRFESRQQLREVPRIGAKTFEQAAGFLRIRGGLNPLDNTAVHPESYALVEKMASTLKVDLTTLLGNQNLLEKLQVQTFITEQTGLLTLNDIMAELAKPGRDPRTQFAPISFADGVDSINDLELDMLLSGVVTNVTNFGAFVDIGVHQDGLVHISNLSHRYIKTPAEVVKVGDHVKVKVVEVDLTRKRIGLSIKDTQPVPPPTPREHQPREHSQPRFSESKGSEVKVDKAQAAAGKAYSNPARPVATKPVSPKSVPVVKPPEDNSSLADKLASAWARNRLK